MNVYEELLARGFCYQQTDAEAIKRLLTTEKIRFYVGFDPTGNSLHVGHLLPVMAMRILQKAGHTPIVLVGGATGQIGDPSGKRTARPILTKEVIADNVRCLREQLGRYITVDNGEAIFVNNLDWFKDVLYIDFLREIGSCFSINRMLKQESIRSRLGGDRREKALMEVNFSAAGQCKCSAKAEISPDWECVIVPQDDSSFVFNREIGYRIQSGGQDQWGNLIAAPSFSVRPISETPALSIRTGREYTREEEGSLTFLEFNYSLLQAYDFYVLNRDLGCKMELGGQDQWGNMVAGTELIRRKNGGDVEVECMTIPLLLDSNGNKFGKTAGGRNVWLDTNRTSVFDYYQFWRNAEDQAVRQLLLYFSPLPVDEIDRLTGENRNINRAKEILAYEATKLAHGAEAAREAYLAAGSRFGFADPDKQVMTSSEVFRIEAAAAELPTTELDTELFEGEGMPLPRLLVEAGLCQSTSDARRLIQGSAVSLNDEKITDPRFAVTPAAFVDGKLVLRAGKKNFRQVKCK